MPNPLQENPSVDNAYFVMSLDFELAWGVVNDDKSILSVLKRRESSCRTSIFSLLNALERYDVPCTWATVGHLFLSHCEKDETFPHKDMPRFKDSWFSQDPCSNLARDPLFYGKDIVERIMSSTVKHEIGYHSFSHVNFAECSRRVARAEMEASREIGKDFGIEFKSFVFPRNEVGHIDLLKEFGFRIYRGRKVGRWKENQSLPARKINGLADRILISPVTPILKECVWEIPTCLHYWNPKSPLSSLWQARLGIRRVVKRKGVFSVYFHPWELVYNRTLEKSVKALLSFVSDIRDRGEITVVTLGELSAILDQES